jgi:hypothetical protein
MSAGLPYAVFGGISLSPNPNYLDQQPLYQGFTFSWFFKTKKEADKYKRNLKRILKKNAKVWNMKTLGAHKGIIPPTQRAHFVPRHKTFRNWEVWGTPTNLEKYILDNVENALNVETHRRIARERAKNFDQSLAQLSSHKPKPTSKRKPTMSKKQKLTKAAILREAKKYQKSRSKKRWWTLLKKFGMDNARKIMRESKKLDADAQYSRKVPKSGKKKVPEHMTETKRKKAEGTYVFPKRKSYPIGDLFHARMAVLRVQWPSNLKNAGKVLRAVVRRWPQYNWGAYWNKERKEAKNSRQIKSYGQTIRKR